MRALILLPVVLLLAGCGAPPEPEVVKPALQEAADACGMGSQTNGFDIADEGRTVILDNGLTEVSADDIWCMLDELDAPASVQALMESTRALDGRQTDEWDTFTASWTYHPDDGLDVILEDSSDE